IFFQSYQSFFELLPAVFCNPRPGTRPAKSPATDLSVFLKPPEPPRGGPARRKPTQITNHQPDTTMASCWDCGKHFRAGLKAVRNHQSATRCAECRRCDDKFDNARARLEHEITDHYHCEDCDRDFTNANNARMHLRSKAHGGGSIECPVCSKAYTTATGVVSHLEGGACPNARHLSRDTLYGFMCISDPGGLVCKKLIGWHGEAKYEATDRTWNGHGYECYVCHRQFGQLQSLNQHLSSPAHQQAYYHCPKSTCRVEFKTMASFINHLESESCGYLRFSDVQKQATLMMGGGRLLGY
ncbi:hypothetical protein RB597_001264, partial [Gaeumannomyces tritici]